MKLSSAEYCCSKQLAKHRRKKAILAELLDIFKELTH